MKCPKCGSTEIHVLEPDEKFPWHIYRCRCPGFPTGIEWLESDTPEELEELVRRSKEWDKRKQHLFGIVRGGENERSGCGN
jgi:hypothetical protein